MNRQLRMAGLVLVLGLSLGLGLWQPQGWAAAQDGSGLKQAGNKLTQLFSPAGASKTFSPVPATAPAAPMATITVTSLADGAANAANCPGASCRLHDAIAKAVDGDTINFSVTGTITLNSGHLHITKNLTINGPGPTQLTISGNNASRVFNINSGVTVALNGLAIINGNSDPNGGGAEIEGGGIRNLGTLTITNSTISGNTAGVADGGGIRNSGTLTITNSALSGNTAYAFGGGILNLGTLTLTNSTLSGNSLTFGAGKGGGISHGDTGTATLTNCTLSGNSATRGGGIDTGRGSLTLTNCTLSGNSAAAQGGGIQMNSGTVKIKNTSIAGNTATSGPDVYGFGAITSLGHNLIGIRDTTVFVPSNNDQYGSLSSPLNPLLAPLANYGGATQTHALLPGSPAINAGDNCVLTNNCASDNLGFNLTTDQRGAGFNRQVGSAVDIGAFESRGFTLAIAGGNNQSTNVNTAFANPLAVTVTAAGAGEPVNGGKVTFTPPPSGASATIAGNPATISGSTATSGTVTANAPGGAYNVAASATGATVAVNFALTNTVPNTPPTISDITNQTINEDSNTGALAFTVSDAQTPAANLLVAGSSSNLTLVPNANIVFGGSGANRTVTITPAANQSGSATITVTVSDGSSITSDTFVLTVNAVNDNPTISDIANQTTNEDTPTSAIAFTIGDVETPAANLTLAGSSSNLTLVPNANIVFGGSGANRTVTITPAANQAGTTTITVTVSDGSGGSTPDSFVLTANAVNDNPTISNVTDQTINEDGSTGALAFTVGDVETPAANLTVAGGSSNMTLVPNASIVFAGSGANRTVTITPAANQSGTATITLTVMDANGGVGNDTFLLTVNAVSDPPTISDLANQAINVNTSTGALPVTVGDAETAAASLTLTGSSSNTTLVPNANIVLGGSGANRTVTVTPAANQSGSTTITLTVTDGNGLTASDTFLLQVNACAATLSKTSQNFAANGGMGSFTVTIANGCTWTAVSNNPSFITVTAPAGTVNGNGTVSFSVGSHSNPTPRSGTITVAGQNFTVRQGAQFLDVPVGASFYEEIGKLSAAGVTQGCSAGNYCPSSSVTREQMAAFIIRALHEPSYLPPAPGAQRFADVPSDSAFYAHIEEMAVRQITLGCGGGNYCPTNNVTREQMAAFIIRALHEPGYVPSTNVPQRFNDVPPSNPFYCHIEEMAVRGITLGCGGGNYCPTQNVLRSQMAAFLVRAFGL